MSGTWKITNSAFGGESDKVKLVLKDVLYKNAPNKFQSSVSLVDANGAKLSAGKDYDTNVSFSYAENTLVPTVDGKKVNRTAGEPVDAGDIPNAGTVIRVTVKGLDAYEDNRNDVLSGTYHIMSADIAKAKVSVNAKAYQNGDAVTLSASDITVTLNGDTLRYGTDYTIDASTYTNNFKKGKAAVIIRGLGTNYGGEKKITFSIASKVLVWWKNLF